MSTTEARTYQSESEAKEIFRSYQDHVPADLLLGFEPDPNNPPEGPYRATCVLIAMEERTVVQYLTAPYKEPSGRQIAEQPGVHIRERLTQGERMITTDTYREAEAMHPDEVRQLDDDERLTTRERLRPYRDEALLAAVARHATSLGLTIDLAYRSACAAPAELLVSSRSWSPSLNVAAFVAPASYSFTRQSR